MTASTSRQTVPVDYSRYLARLVQARPELAAEIQAATKVDARALDAALLARWLDETPLNEDTLKPALRRLKQRAMARIASRDLAARADLAEVVESMTLLAETVVSAALAVTEAGLVTRYGTPQNAAGKRQELIVIGMGKLGGRELNVSSDIDLIFVYPEDGDTDGSRSISNFEFFSRVGKGLINAIADITGDGQVFRVDMRLRPNGDSGPLVCSFDMLENYFITQGREWERYAWIKARPLTGTRHAELENLRQHFVFRKYLDFGAINAMRDLHTQIRREVVRKDMANNVKLGPGGIREIEFIAQVFQLIRGGRDRALQIKPTLEVLKLLVDRDQLELDTVVELSSAYRFLRRLEHRLQYLDDAQTHALPENADDQARVARALGFGNYAALLIELDDHRQAVARHFAAIFADPNEAEHALDPVWSDADGHGAALTALGFRDVATLCARLAALRSGSRYQQMSESTRQRFDTLVPRAIQAAAASSGHSFSPNANQDETLLRILDLLGAISRRAAYLALLLQYPHTLEQVAKIASASSWAADYLLHHPILLDELLDPRLLQMPPDWPAFRQQLAEQTDALEPDTEQQMDALREAHHAQVFRLVSQDVAGLLQLEKLSDHLSELADILVGRTIDLAWRKLLKKHRDTPAFAVISYGKLGGKELGYASDLDLVYLFDDPAPEAAEVYSKLGTRLNTWLSSRTSSGILFETDLRLRPNGDAGLVVSPLDAFRKYQLESAWIWEHQALTRARFTAGDPAIGAAFEKIRCEVLQQRRDRAKLREEVLAMRRKMSDKLTSRGDAEAFDLKHAPGGLVDVEFIVQYLILAHACDHPRLTGNLGNIALLRIAAECGLIPAKLAEEVRDAYREYRRLQHLRRLNNLDSRIAATPVAHHATAVRALWQHVFGA